jgi:cystathionine beta-lyase/cystathionine gamma-synthase
MKNKNSYSVDHVNLIEQEIKALENYVNKCHWFIFTSGFAAITTVGMLLLRIMHP